LISAAAKELNVKPAPAVRFLAALIAIVLLTVSFAPPLSAAVPPDPPSASLAAFSCDNVTEIPKSECEALVALYNSTDGPAWMNNTGWLQTVTPCSWFGIKCESGRVIELVLGGWPKGNGLQGELPRILAACVQLRTLNLEYNQLSGPIPQELGSLTALEVLSLGGNKLSSHIPVTLGNLSNLWKLELWGNDLEGPIPVELGNLKKLAFLYLSGNELTGSIPPEVAALPSLLVLNLHSNQLTGPIPPLPSPDYIYLAHNQLSGEIPVSLTKRGRHTIDLAGNRLTGPIPSDWGNYSNSTLYFFVDNNFLTGALPLRMMSLTLLKGLTYENTDLCAPTDSEFQSWLSSIKYVRSTGNFCGTQVVTGLIWNDANRNSGQDAGEGGIEGATVTLAQAKSAASADVEGRRIFTDKDGRYRFDSVATGAHTVSVAKPGYLPSGSATVPITVPEGGVTVPPVGIAWAPTHLYLPVLRK
jgi:hypothetical protein